MKPKGVPENWSRALFFLGCVPVRLALAYMGTVPKLLPAVAAMCATFAAGMAGVYVWDMRPRAAEGGGGPTYWDCLRPIHAALFFGAGLYAWRGSTAAGTLLLIDALLGVASHMSRKTLAVQCAKAESDTKKKKT